MSAPNSNSRVIGVPDLDDITEGEALALEAERNNQGIRVHTWRDGVRDIYHTLGDYVGMAASGIKAMATHPVRTAAYGASGVALAFGTGCASLPFMGNEEPEKPAAVAEDLGWDHINYSRKTKNDDTVTEKIFFEKFRDTTGEVVSSQDIVQSALTAFSDMNVNRHGTEYVISVTDNDFIQNFRFQLGNGDAYVTRDEAKNFYNTLKEAALSAKPDLTNLGQQVYRTTGEGEKGTITNTYSGPPPPKVDKSKEVKK